MSVRMRVFGAMTGALMTATLVLAATPASADRLATSDHGGKPFAAELSGANEVPPNPSPATGVAVFTVNPGQAEVCWDFSFNDLTSPAIAAHIHQAPAGTNGPVVIPTPVPAANSGDAQGCATVDRSLADDIRDNPEGYYLNVHTATFPGGEIRGQLHR